MSPSTQQPIEATLRRNRPVNPIVPPCLSRSARAGTFMLLCAAAALSCAFPLLPSRYGLFFSVVIHIKTVPENSRPSLLLAFFLAKVCFDTYSSTGG